MHGRRQISYMATGETPGTGNPDRPIAASHHLPPPWGRPSWVRTRSCNVVVAPSARWIEPAISSTLTRAKAGQGPHRGHGRVVCAVIMSRRAFQKEPRTGGIPVRESPEDTERGGGGIQGRNVVVFDASLRPLQIHVAGITLSPNPVSASFGVTNPSNVLWTTYPGSSHQDALPSHYDNTRRGTDSPELKTCAESHHTTVAS